MYDIDIIWHTHQLHPIAYAKDMTSSLGYVMNHDDTDQDRNSGSKLSNVSVQTFHKSLLFPSTLSLQMFLTLDMSFSCPKGLLF